MGRDPAPTRLSKAIDRYRQHVQDSSNPSEGQSRPAHPQSVREPDVDAALDMLLSRDDGWLRVTPQEDGERVYWKWKWTAGPHIHHYVMVVYPKAQCSEAILRLALKIDAVDRGEKAPVKDHYFKG